MLCRASSDIVVGHDSVALTAENKGLMVPAVTYEPQPARSYRRTPLGDFLRKYREDNNLTQEELAAKLQRGRTALAGWEFGRGVSVKNRAHIAKTLGVKPEVLGPAWDPQEPRSAYKRRNIDRAMPLDDTRDGGVTSALPQHLGRSVDMAGYPDPELLGRFLGLWMALPSAESRQRVFECAVGELTHGAPPRAAVPKVRA